MTEYQTIRTSAGNGVGWIELHRPHKLNALSTALMHEVVDAAERFDADESIGAIVVTGSDRVFAAGADIAEMEHKSGPEILRERFFADWTRFADVRTPVIAAVSGYALGGGCEVAMMCDIILAGDDARFGQPEINLAVIPGMGGTQRLVRAVGYYKAAELVLTGRIIDAEEAERIGLVSRVVPASELRARAQELAEEVASRSRPAVHAAKASLDAALESALAEGLRYERLAFAGLFDTADQKEGMAAFTQKRRPRFSHQ
ncbi:enoyl-CoA hydratase [Microbacterium trichothecenolyticum]|uniref:enoyl-CoA hydratase-related protein n=1 Tax=Microbacterium trichothecenolyticum TaxID=69370 RepID=UPI00285C22B4|nr:enoyl-CoA hydratase-related protein [Microbacterium trichothecenolyticum]MDR7112265.1 enoyl-CoA hydratase [Microbacterium trichothecenolyticum]